MSIHYGWVYDMIFNTMSRDERSQILEGSASGTNSQQEQHGS
jgi:hypothetical protein